MRNACSGQVGQATCWCCSSLSLGQVELEGLTGHIEFNSRGQRSNYALKILQLTRSGFRQVGLAVTPWWQASSSFLCHQPSPPWHSGQARSDP